MVGTHDVVLDTSNIFVNRFNVVYIYIWLDNDVSYIETLVLP